MPIIRFYEELNDYLPKNNRKQDIDMPIKGHGSIGSLLTSLKVPLAEVDLILVNGEAVDAECSVSRDDRISVYPVFERFNIEDVTRVRPRPLRRLKFIADSGLDELSDKLNAMGLDTVYDDSGIKAEMIHRSEKEQRIILTLDPAVVTHGSVNRAIILTSRVTENQVQEIRRHLDL